MFNQVIGAVVAVSASSFHHRAMFSAPTCMTCLTAMVLTKWCPVRHIPIYAWLQFGVSVKHPQARSCAACDCSFSPMVCGVRDLAHRGLSITVRRIPVFGLFVVL